MTGFLIDCKHALRLYVRTPLASFIAVAVLAIGAGFVTLFVSLYITLLLRPHPGFEQPRQLVTFGPGVGTQLITTMQRDLIERIANETTSLEAAAGIFSTQLQIDDEPDRRLVELVTREFFPGLRPKLALGRGFAAADYEAEAEPVAVISSAYWQQRFAGSPDVLATTIGLLGASSGTEESVATDVRIVGVMAPEYQGFQPSLGNTGVSIWLPDEHGIALLAPPPRGGDPRSVLAMAGLGRRSPGASSSAIGVELTGRFGESPEQPAMASGQRFEAIDGVVPSVSLVRELGRALRMFLAASLLLALVAAANATLFLLARAPERRRELAIRLSVGAPIRRLARQLVTEAALFLAVAGAIAVALAAWLAGLLREPLARVADTSLDWRALAVLGGCLILLTALVSVTPVLGLRQLGIGAGSRQVTARASLAQRIAGTIQVTIAGSLSSAGLAFAWQVGVLIIGHPGYEMRNLHFATFSQTALVANRAVTSAAAPTALASGYIDAERRHAAIAALPGVTAVSISGIVPGGQAGGMASLLESPLDPAERLQVRVMPVDARWADMLGLRFVDGRAPAVGEAGVAVINQALAQALFGRDDAAGESVSLSTAASGQGATEIVGVIEDISFAHPSAEVSPMAFVTSMPRMVTSFAALIESELTSADLYRQLRDLAASGAIEIPPANVRPLSLLRRNLLLGDIIRAVLTIVGAGLVVVLAASGFYGMQRHLVSAGRREYAIHASLGAGPRALGRLVMKRGLLLGLPGIVIGTLGALVIVAWLRDNYVPREMSVLAIAAAVAAVLALLLLAASWAPARHARRTQPAPLLRED
jgi:predicted permease